MIQIRKKENCCGCNACVQVCPVSCIRLYEDQEGFWYPKADEGSCINCGLCERVCPCLNIKPARNVKFTFAAKTNNEALRKQSSSGGLFSELAEWIIRQNGVVFGARFSKDWIIVHDYTDKIEELDSFRGSKYVQSQIGNSYKQAQTFLKQGRWVLFVGTSCQIAGLNLFLKKKYDRLIAVDVVCHGVPSPKVWNRYLEDLTGDQINKITDIQFRNKRTGWKKYSSVCKWNDVEYQEVFAENLYMKGFFRDLYLRPSCYKCPSKMFAANSDLTLADYWGIQYLNPELDDDLGTGLVFVHTEKSLSILNDLNINKTQISFEPLIKYNPSIRYATVKVLGFKRWLFFFGLNKDLSAIWLLKVFTKRLNLMRRIRRLFIKRT